MMVKKLVNWQAILAVGAILTLGGMVTTWIISGIGLILLMVAFSLWIGAS